ncbi:MAG: YjbQ family protein [candidate division Zixibacteria bacterium]|nr:YjbQ family protein [candidate division Zixibacteria bacterium]
MVSNYSIKLSTKGFCDIHDITGPVEESVSKSGVSNGMVNIFCPGSTGGLTTLEYEPGLQKDLPELMEKLIPSNKSYEHDKTWGDGNGFSHLRSAMIGPSLTLPVVAGKTRHGTWQQIVFLCFDNRSRDRELVITVMGE